MHANAKLSDKKGITYPKLITEIDLLKQCKHMRYFKLPLPIALGEGYRQVTSWNAFFHGDREKNIRFNGSGQRWLTYIGREFSEDNMTEVAASLIDVLDMWDLYRMIGYDWKNREWYDPNTGDRDGTKLA